MNCKEFMQNPDSYIEGEMQASDLLNFEQHIESCETCKKEFTSLATQIRHKNKIHGNNKIKCETCGQEFKQKRYLVKHIDRMH